MGKPPTTEWGRRAAAVGLDRETLATMAGIALKNVTEGLQGKRDGGVPMHLRTIILAGEAMPEEARASWIAATREEAKG